MGDELGGDARADRKSIRFFRWKTWSVPVFPHGDITVQAIKAATENGASVIVNVRTELGGLHAIVVDSVESGVVGIRDPWPLGVGSTYSVPASALEGILNGGVIVHP